MKKIYILLILSLLFIKKSLAQVDSLTFSTDKGLLVFDGYLNGVKTNFAFDTGASLGVLNSQNISEAKIEITGSRRIRDSQQKFARIGKATIENVKIGSQNFTGIISAVTDMPFLYCNSFYLLGGDVIKQLNWKFNFKKKLVYFSKTPFEPRSEMIRMPFQLFGNRHFSTLNVAGKKIDKVLIDFGFAGNCTTEIDDEVVKQIFASQPADNIFKSKSSSMGLNSVSTGIETSSFYSDSVTFGSVKVQNFKISTMKNTQNKIGLTFLKNNFSEIIINNSDLNYWLLPNRVVPAKTAGFDAGFYYNDKGKIEVVALNSQTNTSAGNLRLGQTIKEINGRSAESFTDRCEFLVWYATQTKGSTLAIVTDKGDKINIRTSVF